MLFLKNVRLHGKLTIPMKKSKLFKKLLIANRGEIACRIIKTAQRLGIQCVAIYSEIDAQALHVALADEAYCIGPALSRDSYLCIDKIIAIAQSSGAQAIHPGYGFLSENADFATACSNAKLYFIGPSANAIRIMGNKHLAKKMIADANIPIIPGYHDDNQNPEYLAIKAEQLGYPILLKPSAGGGGKGMHIVHHPDDFLSLLATAKREAKASFDDDQLILEKIIEQPRHIEVQIFGDQHGNIVHLFERDCSIQRRHQKVIEEAPAINIAPDVLQKMRAIAIKIAQTIQYVGAGTVEFLLAPNDDFYFMEMNTRLQVEHPVTEMISQQDLVEWQLRVAAGEILPAQQSDITMHGHAIEARIYAEDPTQDFLPSIGQITDLQLPAENQHVRIDTGIRSGDIISPYYDALIAKLIVWDKNRADALLRLKQALRDIHLTGIQHNTLFLKKIIDHTDFCAVNFNTNFIEQLETNIPNSQIFSPTDPNSPWALQDGWRLNHVQAPRLNHVQNSHRQPPLRSNNHNKANSFLAPLPGIVAAILVQPGQKVSAGTNLMILEAMKMEHIIRANSAGIIKKIFFAVGDTVDASAELLEFENVEH